jgi:hypothetical protein
VSESRVTWKILSMDSSNIGNGFSSEVFLRAMALVGGVGTNSSATVSFPRERLEGIVEFLFSTSAPIMPDAVQLFWLSIRDNLLQCSVTSIACDYISVAFPRVVLDGMSSSFSTDTRGRQSLLNEGLSSLMSGMLNVIALSLCYYFFDPSTGLLAEQPITEQPIADQSITDQPIADQPITDQPITDQPIADQLPPSSRDKKRSPSKNEKRALSSKKRAKKISEIPMRQMMSSMTSSSSSENNSHGNIDASVFTADQIPNQHSYPLRSRAPRLSGVNTY